MAYLALAGVVFGINLLPAFGPPTWAVLVFFSLQSNLAPVPLVLVGALAAASGRLVLAYGSRGCRGRMKTERIEHLEAAREALAGGRKRTVAGLGLFALSPLPSAQLFVAAGLLAVPLVPLTLAFFAGRLVSYTIYVTAASAARGSLGSILQSTFRSPLGIALQLVLLGCLVALLRVDWTDVLTRRVPRSKRGPTPNQGSENSVSSLPTRPRARARMALRSDS